ncbi:HAD family hydrolase [Akkermansia sp. AKK6]
MKKRVDLPEKKYEGYIFDLDGTLVDSMPLHYKAWRKALARAGAPDSVFREDEFYSCGGKSANDVVSFLNARYGLVMDAASTAADKRRIYLEMLEEEGMEPIHEVVEFVRSLGDAPKAIATGSAIPGASRTLAAAGLSGLFDVILTPEDVENGKPAPDMFLKAAELLGAAPGRCVVFEDAVPGIKAAAAAGMDCVQVRRPSLA